VQQAANSEHKQPAKDPLQEGKGDPAGDREVSRNSRPVGRARKRRRPDHEPVVPSTPPSAFDPSLFINRELSWLEFNQRVLDEARDHRHPLLERVKFLSIVSSNLDEFFMIRVAALKDQILADVSDHSPDGRTPASQLAAVHERVSQMLADMSDCFWHDLYPRLTEAGIELLGMNALTEEERVGLRDLFAREIFPVLTPLAFDPGHPFPYISNLSLSLAVVVATPAGDERFARVKVPDVLSRLVPLPDFLQTSVRARFVWLEDLIADNLEMLFPGMTVREAYAFRITRNADIEIQEDEADDLLSTIEQSIRKRRFGTVVRVGVQKSMPARIKDILAEYLDVTATDMYEISPPLGLSHLMSLLRLPRPDLKDVPFHPTPLATEDDNEDMFSVVRRGDVLLHHPYDSFGAVVQFIKNAAEDPNVLAIKQTLYRIGKESPLIPLFIKAAETGKQVAVLVELKARFDEENNIIWAKQLEEAGVHVVYGLVGLKTHAKMALIVRREAGGIRRYVHLGTGNYNPVTARIYTDVSLFTCREDITADATEVFNYLTGYSTRETYRKLALAPVNLRKRFNELLDREIDHARTGKPARIILKMNSLTDVRMIEHLYDASRAGVDVDLIIRGICCLRPKVPGVSERIRVLSIVGRFLEHSRVFYFSNNGAPEIFLSSADLMGRNLDRRVELMFPIEDPALARRVKEEILDTALADAVRGRLLDATGTYTLHPHNGDPSTPDSQSVILRSRLRSTRSLHPIPREAP
jgi:polyphosphate kinase